MADRKLTAEQMDKAIRQFHSTAAQIDDPNFKAFAGLMRVYLGAYNREHGGGTPIPMELKTHELEYVTNRMALIFNKPAMHFYRDNEESISASTM